MTVDIKLTWDIYTQDGEGRNGGWRVVINVDGTTVGAFQTKDLSQAFAQVEVIIKERT